MKIIEKMAAKAADNSKSGVTIAFLGDSVTQGCFELYKKENNAVETIFDKRYAYSSYVYDIFCTLYPSVSVNIINAGISGDCAPSGFERIDRDVLCHKPDLTVVCYGLNDCGREPECVSRYTSALEKIFDRLAEEKSEIIFMTPNMMNTKVSVHIHDVDMRNIAVDKAMLQNDSIFDAHIEAARAICRERSIPVCDCYAVWKKLASSGVDTTELLSNKINHPTREMNKLFAIELVKTMFCE